MKKCIVVLQPEFRYGGVEKQTILLTNHLMREGWDVTVISQKPGANPKVVREKGIIRIYLPFAAANIVSIIIYVVLSLFLIFFMVLLKGVRIVHSQLSLRSLFVASLSRILFGTVFSVKATERFAGDELDMGLRKFFPVLQRSIDLFILLSKKMQRRLTLLGVEKARERLIRNGVEDSLVCKDSNLTRRIQNIENGTINMIFVGRLSPEKGADKLIRACTLLRDHKLNFTLKVVGSGPEANRLIRLVNSLFLEHKISFLGFLPLDRVYAEMRESDIFVLPSETEGLPNSLLEAMALGLVVIATPVGAVSEIVKHGDNGLLLRSNDPQEIAGAVESLVFEPEQVAEICAKATRTIEEGFLLSKSLRQYNEAFEGLLSPERSPNRGYR